MPLSNKKLLSELTRYQAAVELTGSKEKGLNLLNFIDESIDALVSPSPYDKGIIYSKSEGNRSSYYFVP